MTVLSPAETLTAAAKLVRERAAAAQHDVDTTEFWACYDKATVWRDGFVNGFGGATSEYAALLTPGVGLALADWLDSLIGIEFSEHGPMPDEFKHALAVARQLLGEAS